ncbi:MAG: hypothetical protein HUJ58_02245 [Erysipelotrichaceae bacterium]|nr:hypothetical protein [Erysipelotrichaceae bacterium]
MKYITINCTERFFGIEAFKLGKPYYMKKEPENEYDGEAILVVGEQDVSYGYVANSVHTVARGTYSAGRIYDTFDDMCKVVPVFIVNKLVIAEVHNNG